MLHKPTLRRRLTCLRAHLGAWRAAWRCVALGLTVMLMLPAAHAGSSVLFAATPAQQASAQNNFRIQDGYAISRTESQQLSVMDSDRYQLEMINDRVVPSGLYAQVYGRSLVGDDSVITGSRLFFSLGYKTSLLGIMGRMSLSNTLQCSQCFLPQEKQQQYGLGIFLHQEARYVFIRLMLSGNWLYSPSLLQRVVKRVGESSDVPVNNQEVAAHLVKTFQLESSFNYTGTFSMGMSLYLPLGLRVSPQFLVQLGGIQDAGNRASSMKWGAYLSLVYIDDDLLQLEAQVGAAHVYHVSQDIHPDTFRQWYHERTDDGRRLPPEDDLEVSLMGRLQLHPLPNLSLGVSLGYDQYQKSGIKQFQYSGNLTINF